MLSQEPVIHSRHFKWRQEEFKKIGNQFLSEWICALQEEPCYGSQQLR